MTPAETYRAERAKAARRNKRKHEAALAAVKAQLEQERESRKIKRGRPRKIVMNVRQSPDALLNALSPYQGQR